MAKAKVELPNGTVIQIEGTNDEIKELLDYYSRQSRPISRVPVKKKAEAKTGKKGSESNSDIDHTEIVNLIKSVDEAELIEKNILDKSSQVDRTLLPLYVVNQYLDNKLSLTSGDISKITTDLGVPISRPNASVVLSGTASKYVISDKVRKKGSPTRYKLSRRGEQYIKSVIKPND